MNKSIRFVLASIIAGAGLVVGCSTAPKNESKTAQLEVNAKAAMESFKIKDPSLAKLLDKSVGYAIFPDIGKAGWILGGSYGKGEVYEAGKKIGYADVSEVSAGFQWGAQNFSQLIIFLKQEDLDNFKKGQFALGANASAVALTAGAAATTDPSKGVIAIVDTKGGLMAEAAIGGQRLRFSPL